MVNPDSERQGRSRGESQIKRADGQTALPHRDIEKPWAIPGVESRLLEAAHPLGFTTRFRW